MRALASLAIILLLYFQHLHIWHIYLVQLVDGIFIVMAVWGKARYILSALK